MTDHSVYIWQWSDIIIIYYHKGMGLQLSKSDDNRQYSALLECP